MPSAWLNLLSTRHSDTIKRLTEILDGVSSLVAAENARMSLEDEVDQATAKAIGSADPAAGSRPAPAPAAPNGPGRSGPSSAGPSAPRPAASTVVADAPPRPAPGPQTQPSPQVQAAPVLQDKPAQARAAVADPGVRAMPGSDDDD